MLPESDRHYPTYLHYVPNFKATLWTLILLADMCYDKKDKRVSQPLKTIQDHFYDSEAHIYSLKKDHFPIPCLNGNMIYLESYFTGSMSEKSLNAIEFFSQYQRFDGGDYITEKNEYCINTSCYGKHSCYCGIVKLLKGLSFIPAKLRKQPAINLLRSKCIPDGDWNLEKKVNNMAASIGEINQPNHFITKRVKEMLGIDNL
jgi:hypothetical protein